jgi:hypothetical protein
MAQFLATSFHLLAEFSGSVRPLLTCGQIHRRETQWRRMRQCQVQGRFRPRRRGVGSAPILVVWLQPMTSSVNV